MHEVAVWDRFVRVFHWSLVVLFFSAFFILDDDGAPHRWAGYAVLGLVVARIIWGFVGTHNARFSSFPPDPAAAMKHARNLISGKAEKPVLTHNPLGALMVYNLLLALTAVCVTGYMMTTDTFWGVDWVEEAHELAANYTLICVGLHVAGVILESRRSKTNLIRAMVTGSKEVPDEA